MKKQVGRSPSVAKAALTGTGVAIALALLCAAVVAKLLDSEVLRMESVGYASMIAHICSVFIGARTAMSRVGNMGQTVAMITGAAYYVCLLLVNALFFGGSFTGLGTTLILVVLSAAASILTAGKGRMRSGRKRYKIPRS